MLYASPARVLIVDDNQASAEALAMALTLDGLETQYVPGGVEAVHLLNSWLPHVFVLDITMPEHSGYAVARVLRRLPSTRTAAIIAFTALAKEEFAALGPPGDFDGYCQKGGSHLPLLTMIKAMFSSGPK